MEGFIVELMSEGAEPSILEYARFYGIALDHRERNPLHATSASDDISAQLTDPPGVFGIDDSSATLPLERLSVGTEAAVLLSSIKELGRHARKFDEDIDIDVHRFRKTKQELPILLTDHECDLESFAPRVVPDLENEHLPLEKLDEEADEGLGWPLICYELPGKFFDEAKAERPDICREGLLYLQDVQRYPPDDGHNMVFEHNKLFYRRVRKKVQRTKIRKN